MIKDSAVNKYFYAVGRRKTAIAKIRLFSESHPRIIINDKNISDYFKTTTLQSVSLEPLTKLNFDKYSVIARVNGGGASAQAEALRHAIARALLKIDNNLRKQLKKAGYLKRDPRMKERRKFGLKKARKAPQWSKR